MSDAGLASHVGLTPAGSHTFVASYGNDTGMHAEFYSEPVYQEFKSKEANRPIYQDEVFVYITRPGAKSDLRRKVRLETDGTIPTDPERFPKQWQQFQNKQEQTHSGTPLEMWPAVTKAQVLELKGAKIHSVEQLGSLPDSVLQNLGMMDARVLRDKAKAYIDKAEEGAQLSKAMQVIDQQRIDIEAMKAQFAELAAERAEQKRGPGRPPKEKIHDDQT